MLELLHWIIIGFVSVIVFLWIPSELPAFSRRVSQNKKENNK